MDFACGKVYPVLTVALAKEADAQIARRGGLEHTGHDPPLAKSLAVGVHGGSFAGAADDVVEAAF